jgi:HAD superfamily hydrolase (TIGR01509 family)
LTGPEAFAGLTGLVFDCDGVLFDSMSANTRYYNLIREGLGLSPMDPEEQRFVHAHTVTRSLARIIPADRLDEAEAVRSRLDYRDVLPYLQPAPGLYQLLDWLLEAGLNMAVLTNRMTTMHLVIERFDLGPYFRPVLTAADVTPKPHPEGLHRILADWKARPGQIAFIGDSEVDRDTARAAGVPFWSYGAGGLGAALHLTDFLELFAALRRAGDRQGHLPLDT